MVARNADHLSKAWAGSLHAAHDEEFQWSNNSNQQPLERLHSFAEAMGIKVTKQVYKIMDTSLSGCFLGKTMLNEVSSFFMERWLRMYWKRPNSTRRLARRCFRQI